jgi:hypothetical protein
MCMRRRVDPAARARPVVPVGLTAGCAASYSPVQLRRGPRTARGPSWARGRRRPAEHAARCLSCGVADSVVYQVGPSVTAHGSSELVKAHTPRRGRPSCRNTAFRAWPHRVVFAPVRASRRRPCAAPGTCGGLVGMLRCRWWHGRSNWTRIVSDTGLSVKIGAE